MKSEPQQPSPVRRAIHKARLIRADLPVPFRQVSLRQDVVLISQVARSGGTLLGQLFDSHPQLLVHPFEFEMGPSRTIWPDLSVDELASADTARAMLYEKSIDRFIAEGLSPHLPGSPNETRYPFRFSRSVYRRAFSQEWSRRRPRTQREAIDVQFSAFWSAWSGCPENAAQAKWIVGFRPGTIDDSHSMERFFGDYPSGRVISIIRDPQSWFVSARRHRPKYQDIDEAIELWSSSAEAAMDLAKDRPEQVQLVSFERLVREVAPTLEGLLDWLGVRWAPSTVVPTLAGRPMRADSSFPVSGFGVRPETTMRASFLTSSERERIDRRCGGLYRAVCDLLAQRSRTVPRVDSID